MIRYELKNKERQAALEKILPEFGDDLQAACDEQFDDEFNHVCVRLSDNGGVFCDDEVNIKVNIKKAAIRAKEVYDPYAWNKYPEVTPPEGVPLRCEGLHEDTGHKFRAALQFAHGEFRFECGFRMLPNTRVTRFRPWDDGEENEK